MGSLNNGRRINQSRKSTRNIGGTQTFSADRVETSGILDVVQQGTTPSVSGVQNSTLGISSIIKTTNSKSDRVVSRTSPTGSAVPTDGLNNPNPFLLPVSS